MTNDRPTGKQLRDVLSETVGLSDTISQFLTDPAPSDPVGNAIHANGRNVCDSYSNAPEWARQLLPGTGWLAMDGLCAQYLDSVGSGPPTPGAEQSLTEFLDGQDLSPYGGANIRYQDYRTGSFFTRCTSGYNTGFGGAGPEVSFKSCAGVVNAVVTTRPDLMTVLSWGCCTTPLEPPPEVPPPVPGPNPNPRPDPGLPPTGVPFRDPKGRIVLPTPEIPNPYGDPIQLPNYPLPDPTETNPDDRPGNPLGGEPENPGDVGEPDPPVDTSLGGEQSGEDTERWLMGVKVEVIAAPPRASGFQTSAGFIYTAAGFVYMGTSEELEYFEESERLLESGQFFPAVRGYDKWRVVASPFYNLRVTPYYKDED